MPRATKQPSRILHSSLSTTHLHLALQTFTSHSVPVTKQHAPFNYYKPLPTILACRHVFSQLTLEFSYSFEWVQTLRDRQGDVTKKRRRSLQLPASLRAIAGCHRHIYWHHQAQEEGKWHGHGYPAPPAASGKWRRWHAQTSTGLERPRFPRAQEEAPSQRLATRWQKQWFLLVSVCTLVETSQTS